VKQLVDGWDVELHRGSHADLLDRRYRPSSNIGEPTIDAIIVPTARPARCLATAAGLATQLGCALVVLCSIRALGHQVADELATRPDLDAAVVDFPAGYGHRLLKLRSSGSRYAEFGHPGHVDLSGKRNTGLLLANLLGWRHIMFLDDDIRGLDLPGLTRASRMLERYRAVGFRVPNYPDNSVVCHAYRLVGGPQDIFIGGSPLLVDVARAKAFFPAIYNEDWLFLYDSIQDRQATDAGFVEQLKYDPYETLSRAEAEEFGDVIGEGLLQLIHWDVKVDTVGRSMWGEFLYRRHRFIEDISRHLLAIGDDSDDPTLARRAQRALKALTAARQRLGDIEPGACASFVRHWQGDLARWSERIFKLPRFSSIGRALRYLDLPPVSLQGSRWRHVGR
jgi:hypothetical protein